MADYNITAFNSGIMSPLVQGRVDFDKYSRGCEDIVNFDILKGGGLRRRSSTAYLAGLDGYVRIEPFVFSETETFLIAFKDKVITVLSQTGGIVKSLDTDYLEADIKRIQILQSADVIFITHQKYPVSKLSRTDDGWLFETLSFEFYPFPSYISQDITLDVSADVDEWSSLTTYITGDYVYVAVMDGEVVSYKRWFKSLIDDNLDNEPPSEGTSDTNWEYIGTDDYIYEDMPTIIATNSDENIFPLSIENAYYLVESKRKDNTLEETLTGTGLSDNIFIRGDYQIRTSGTWDGSISLQKSDTDGESADWVTVNVYVADEDVNYNQSGTDEDGSFYRVSHTLASGSVKVSLSNQNFVNKGIFQITGIDSTDDISRGSFYDNSAVLHYEMEDSAANKVVWDSIGSFNGAILKDTTSEVTDTGVVDNGFDLDGNYINIPSVTALNSNKFTVSMWAKCSGATTLFSYRSVFRISVSSGGVVTASRANVRGRQTLRSINTISFNKWVHIAFSFDRYGSISLYIDGQLQSMTGTINRSSLYTGDSYCLQNCIADEFIVFDDTPSEEVDIYRLYALNSNKYTAIAKRRSKNNVLSTRWARNLFNSFNGYPASSFIYEGRLWLTGTIRMPNVLVASKISDYTNFEYGVNDDEAMYISFDSGKQDRIHWIYGERLLSAGTADGEWSIESASQTKSITPETIKVRKQTSIGSMPMRPVMANGRLIYPQADGKVLRDFKYDYQIDGYSSEDITVLIDNLFTDRVKELVFKQYPSNILYILLEDSSLIALTFDIANTIIAASRYVIDGDVLSICTLPVVGGEYLYLLVKRNGYTVLLSMESEDFYQDKAHLDYITSIQNTEEQKEITIANTTALYGYGAYGVDAYGGVL